MFRGCDFRFLKGGMFWVGYWTCLFLVEVDADCFWPAMGCILMSGLNLWTHRRSIDKIMQELGDLENKHRKE